MPNQLIIANHPIAIDNADRINLNDIYRASNSKESKRPSQWLRTQATKELIAELESQNADMLSGEKHHVNMHLALSVVHGGNNQGTYAHELLAISYAGWISPKFQLQVNQAFIQSHQQPTSVFLPLKEGDMVISKDAMIAQQAQLIATQSQLLTLQQEKLQPKAKREARPSLTDDEISLIHKLKKQGLAYNEIAKITQRSKSAISYILRGAKGGAA